jgi:AraC family transcriptional regulator of adaptative response/methylated-DNA-[protein]-cysteine methyltransferase
MTAVMTRTDPAVSTPAGFSNDDERWQAVVRRDPAADGEFYYSVKTTGVYCRPSCAARLPRRENVRFHATRADAERAGFRPCKRCRPDAAPLAERQAAVVAIACRAIEEAEQMPSLDDLAKAAGRPFPFTACSGATGVPETTDAHRAQRVRDELTKGSTVTEAIYGAGSAPTGASTGLPQAARDGSAAFRAGGRGVDPVRHRRMLARFDSRRGQKACAQSRSAMTRTTWRVRQDPFRRRS